MDPMETNALRYGRPSQPLSVNSLKQRRSGYEPSDTETDWQESPLHDQNQNNGVFGPQSPKMNLDLPRNISPMRHNRKLSSKFDDSSPKKESMVSPVRRRHTSKSPYKARKEDGRTILPISVRRNVSPFSKSEHRRQVSPFKSGREEHDMHKNDEIMSSRRRKDQRTPSTEDMSSFSQLGEVTKMSERLSHSRRSVTAPRQRIREKDQENNHVHREQKGERTPSPLTRSLTTKQREREASHIETPSVGELNELVANIKMSRSPTFNAKNFENTESMSPGDIFFSREHTALMMQKNGLPKNGKNGTDMIPRPTRFPQMDSAIHQLSPINDNIEHNPPRTLRSSGSRTTMISSSAGSRQSSEKFSTESSKMSESSRTTSASMKKFTANRKKSQSDAWFSCMRMGPCRTSRSPEKKQFDEASFIEKAFVVENLRKFWADKHQPCSLNGFTCHKQEAQLLKQLVSLNNIPHILLKGPSGSGKRSLAMALLCEIFGDACRNISHDLRYFQVQEKRAMQAGVPITSSAYHVELNVNLEPNAKNALMGLVKEISNTYAIVPEVSNATFKPDYKVLVLYQVNKATENIQHLIKWIMDCYTDTCKLILCCEDDVDIIESVKNRCQVIKVDAPITHEIMEVLIQIARKEDFDLPMNFAARVAAKSKQNLRKAIMALEACKAHNYPFADDQPIPFGWEEVLVELATEILTDPSPKRLFLVRGKFQKLLVDFVHPKLILLKLVEHFLKGVEASSRRELYYWHAYYDKRLPTGSSALLKLEEFVAKFMSIHRKNSSSGSHQYE